MASRYRLHVVEERLAPGDPWHFYTASFDGQLAQTRCDEARSRYSCEFRLRVYEPAKKQRTAK